MHDPIQVTLNTTLGDLERLKFQVEVYRSLSCSTYDFIHPVYHNSLSLSISAVDASVLLVLRDDKGRNARISSRGLGWHRQLRARGHAFHPLVVDSVDERPGLGFPLRIVGQQQSQQVGLSQVDVLLNRRTEIVTPRRHRQKVFREEVQQVRQPRLGQRTTFHL